MFECSWLARLLANALVLGLSPALTVPKSLLLYRWLAYTWCVDDSHDYLLDSQAFLAWLDLRYLLPWFLVSLGA